MAEEAIQDLTPDKPELAPRPLDFPVIGVGSSAGGLEAFGHFLKALDPGFSAAYILVQHLDPTHESMLTELLARYTNIPVAEITDGVEIRPGTVYVIPSASGLEIEDGVLRLIDFEAPRGFRRPIDDFFQTLAIDQGPNAAAIVLSGTGGDGTVGIRHVKEAGGLTLAQDPEEAAYDGMPSSAIATGLVDHVIPVAAMPTAAQRFFVARATAPPAGALDREDFITRVMELVRSETGHDFSHYKINTILRRVQRRMQVLDLARPTDYLAALSGGEGEAEALFQDLLINVTAFFRDPEVFNRLREEVIPEIVKGAGPDHPIRIWVPGCSSGEEPYSIAILVAEALARGKSGGKGGRPRPEVQILATDIDEEMLERARAAVYMPSVVADIPPELLERYFTPTEGGYAIVPMIRDMVRVSAHSVIKDPPFSRLDLVSCRNLLIYFDNRLQSRVLPLFHYALRPSGWLVLGSAENLAGRDDLFRTVNRVERIYRKLPKSDANFVLPLQTRAREAPQSRRRAETPRQVRDEREERVVKKALERYTLPHVVVDPDGIVQHASARTAPFLQLSVGTPSMRLLDLAPSSLRPALRAILSTIADRRRRVIRRGIEMGGDEMERVTLDLIADPLDAFDTMIVFRETARQTGDEDDLEADVGDFRTEERIQELEDELGETRSALRTTVEELETSNEELKSSNEEMMSMNEELQSANEELSTVNEELKSKLDEFARLNADHVNFLESTRIATVFVDRRMRLRSFTPAARRLFHFAEHDRGRPLADVRTDVGVDEVQDAIATVLEGRQVEAAQLAVGRRTYTFRALPYLDQDQKVDGAVLVFDDVSQLVEAQSSALALEQTVAAGRLEIERLYESAPIGMALFDRDRRYRRINQSLADYNGAPQEAHLGRTITDMLPEIGPQLDEIISRVFETGEGINRWELHAGDPKDPSRMETFELDIYPLVGADGEVQRIGMIVHRVTESRRLERELRHLMAELQHRVKNSLATVMSIVRQTVRTSRDPGTLAETLTRRIGALAATHALLTTADWTQVPVRRIVEQEVAPYANRDGVTLQGAEVGLHAKAAVAFTLVIHELTTNAAKHGALGVEGGRLAVAWTREDGHLALTWRETVPGPVTAPTRRGFGLKFIERSLAHDLGGEVRMSWTPEGLHVDIDMPLRDPAEAHAPLGVARLEHDETSGPLHPRDRTAQTT